MTYLVASDIHGSAYYCRQILDAFEKEKADRLLLLGDLLYHGPRNPLPEEYNPKDCFEMLNAYKDRILAVRGNCDADVDQMVLQFPITAEYLWLDLNGRTVFVSHGDKWSEANPPELPEGSVMLGGHTHYVGCTVHPGFVYMNPGSPSLPKDHGHRGYILLSPEKAIFKTMDGEEFQTYCFKK